MLRMLRAYLALEGSAPASTGNPYDMVLRRLQQHSTRQLLGPETSGSLPTWRTDPLLAALRSYLLTHQYQAVTYRDLWRDVAQNTSGWLLL